MQPRTLLSSTFGIIVLAALSGCVVVSSNDDAADGAGGTAGASAAGGTGGAEVTPPLEYSIDTALAPSPATLDDGNGRTRPLAAIRDDDGVVSKLVENEILVKPASQAELDDLVARLGAEIVASNAVPEPPASLNVTLSAADRAATEYVLRVDTSKVELTTFVEDAKSANIGGKLTISSDAAARLLSIVVHESASGVIVSPNFVLDFDGKLLRVSKEAPVTGGNLDGLTASAFQNSGNESRASAALQFNAARTPMRRVNVAVIDGGFWLDGQGHPLTVSGNVSDLPTNVAQYDFVDNDAFAGGQNAGSCTGGSMCRWHGNDSASVAVGTANNAYGALGTGGLVGDPILLRVGSDWGSTATAIRVATLWNADVISMSLSGGCDNVFCDAFYEAIGMYPSMRSANEHGVVMVSSAGNDGKTADEIPCRNDHVICVGALASASRNAISYSNYGKYVDIWAPTNIPAMPRPNDSNQLVADGKNVSHSGTSASAPFVAGVAAMIRAYDPTLDSDEMLGVLLSTAKTGSGDPKVTASIDAYAALIAAAGPTLDKDAYEPNDTPQTALVCSSSSQSEFVDSTIASKSDKDYYRASLPEFTTLQVDQLYTSYIGSLAMGLNHDDACGYAALVKSSTPSVGAKRATYRLTPDSWVFPVSGTSGGLDAYQLTFLPTAAPLSADGWEGITGNDTLANARQLWSATSYTASLHSLSDVDYYRITNPGTGGGTDYIGFWFDVVAEDMPITARLYDSNGVEVASAASSSDCNAMPHLNVPVGTYSVKIEAAKRGEYSFVFGDVTLPPKKLVQVKHIFKHEMLGPDPTSGLLLGNVEYFRTITNIDHPTLELIGAELNLAILDLEGNELAQGTPVTNAAGEVTGASVSLGGLPSNQEFLISVARADGDALIEGVALPYSLTLATQ